MGFLDIDESSMMKCQRILSHNNSSDGNKVNHILQYLEEEKRKTQCKKYNYSDKFSRDESNIYKQFKFKKPTKKSIIALKQN